jgi:hypothetical protein
VFGLTGLPTAVLGRSNAAELFQKARLLKLKVLQRYQWVILNAECVSPSESEQQSQGLLNRIVFCVGFDRPFIHRAIRCARG